MEAFRFIDSNTDIELIFLDINLPELTGLEFAGIVPPELKIIFTTAHSDYAVKSYEVNSVDYLLKPVTYPRFLQAAMKAKNLIVNTHKQEVSDADSKLFLKSGRKIIQVNWNDILYVEAMKEYLSVVTLTQKILIYKRMAELEVMQPRNFKRVHNSYIINLDKVERVEDNMVYLNGREIPVGKSYKEKFFSEIRNRLL
jgi:DNA-binding LytR/AlgR family response regulator